MKKKVFNSLFVIVILFCFGACDKENNIKTFSLSFGENVFLVKPTVIDTKKIPEGIEITVFVLIPDDKVLDRFEVNNMENSLGDGDVYKFRIDRNTNISASFKDLFSLELGAGISVIEPDKLDLDKVKEGERLTIRGEIDSNKAVKCFKLNDDIELSEFTYKLGEDKIYAETSFVIEGNSSVGLESSDELKIPPINFYKREGEDVLLLRKEIKFNKEKVLIPNFVSIIEKRAFFEDSIIESVIIPDSVRTIGSYAFSSCSNLDSIDIPKSVTSFGGYVFDGTPWLENKLLANNGLAIVNNILISSDKTKDSFELPLGIIDIASSSFIYNSVLTDIIIPDGVIKIGSTAFAGCSNLESITIPDSVETMEDGIFSGCTSLTSVLIPNGVTSVEPRLFYGCAALTSFVIPDSVTTIGFNTFYGCSGLTSLIIPNSVTTIGYGAFNGCSGLTSVIIPNSVTTIGFNAFNGCSGLISVTIPNSVTTIEDSAFRNCSRLTSVTIPNSVTTIERNAFNGCSGLTSVTIPNSVTTIERNAFSGCSLLTSIIIPEEVTSMGSRVFRSCSNLSTIYCRASDPTPETVPDGWDEDWKKSCSATVVWGYTGD